MDGFEVPTDLVTTAGQAAGRVADALAGLDLAGPVRDLAAALPGGRTATLAARPGWAELAALGGRARRHSDALDAAARAYLDAEAAARAAAGPA
ncbi:hypothetical protein [Pseudonocardia humida]|uniref:Excreted virulence factor EspC (Type VII ESX diderm) n=1 Tax=Pseudonocardia humida TaxID=2800819 RepID=A0ABT0ZSY7_9PSEU|nr:hypothetical protein [Pseudonocardia humida]MCO1653804.1 hypothetical protein [Pseudonocardia humida]